MFFCRQDWHLRDEMPIDLLVRTCRVEHEWLEHLDSIIPIIKVEEGGISYQITLVFTLKQRIECLLCAAFSK